MFRVLSDFSSTPYHGRSGLLRALLVGIGAIAGLCLWLLVDILPDISDNARLALALTGFAGSFFAISLVTVGPLLLRAALTGALAVALPAAGLLFWASFRHDGVGDFLRTGHVVVAFLALVALPVPFLIAGLRPGEGWLSSRALFLHGLRTLMRLLVALVFSGLFWLVVLLSDAVLKVVGIGAIGWLLGLDPVPWLICGAVLGLGLALGHEMRHRLSPELFLRLFRLLLPPVLAVSAVFLLAVPLRGLSNLFGALSPALLLMSLAGLAVALIAAVLGASDLETAGSRTLLTSARLMALVSPFLGALAVVAVGQRVGQYGWSPVRLTAAVLAGLVLAWGLAQALAAPRADWKARIRRANATLTLAGIALAALWLTPLLDAERIAARSQLARFESGRTAPEALDLWTLAHDWGRAGEAALARLSDPAHPRAEELAGPLARLAAARNRWEWLRGEETATSAARLLEMVPVFPPGASLPEVLLADRFVRTQIAEACARSTPAGNSGCLAWIGDFSASRRGQEVLLLFLDHGGDLGIRGYTADNVPLSTRIVVPWTGRGKAAEIIDRIRSGAVRPEEVGEPVLLMGEGAIRLLED